MATVYEGTWEEVAAHAAELSGRKVKLIVEDRDEQAVIQERLKRLERGLARIREIGESLPPVPPREITLDVLYPDEDERG